MKFVMTDLRKKHIAEFAGGFPLLCVIFNGLRRSEICALTIDDVDGDTVSINKALVLDKDKNWVVKTTKTTASTRTIVIPSHIADLIRTKWYKSSCLDEKRL